MKHFRIARIENPSDQIANSIANFLAGFMAGRKTNLAGTRAGQRILAEDRGFEPRLGY